MKTYLLALLVLMTGTSLAQKKKSNQVTLPVVKVVDRPSIGWLTYEKDTTVVGTNIQTFSCLIKSRLPLRKIEVLANGIITDVYGVNDFLKAVEEHKYEQPIELTVTLRTGSNTLLVRATNDYGVVVESLRRVVVDPNQIATLRNEKDRTPPMIYVSNPANINYDYVRVYEDIIRITGTVIDESGIQYLRINDVVTPLKANGAFVINLPLNVGENPITIEAKDINQNIALKKFIIDRKNLEGSEYKFEEAKNYLIVIGINKYTQWPELYNAVPDARSVEKALVTHYKFDPENVIMLLDSAATRFNIFDALRKYIERITPKDNLMIYFSGHGYFDKLLSEGYWIPIDAGEEAISDFIPNSQILRIIENINSQHTFLVADACFSGSLFASTTRGYSEHVEKYRSRWGLASGRLEKVSDGEVGKNSPFAESFVQYLNSNKDSKVVVSDLVQHVKKKVSEISDQTPIGNPLKGVGDEGGEFVFYKRDQ